jgi:pyruvate formate lyase activating enzyme
MISSHLEKDLRACELCEHRCGVDRLAGDLGVCRMGGPIVASRTLHPAPPESYTIFTAGCNFKCLNCQNWSISQFPDNGMPVDGHIDPESLAVESHRALESPAGKLMRADRIFWSGGEATIHLPFIEEVVTAARRLNPSCRVNFDTNGFMTEASLRRILRFTSSVTFDIKAFHDDTHRAITGAPVAPVLRNAEMLAREAPEKLWEFRILVIPEINHEDIGPLCRFIGAISRDLPVCFLAFRPNYVLDTHQGPSKELMNRCLEMAREAGLVRAAWSGVTDIPGEPHPSGKTAEKDYEKEGAKLAASYAKAAGCQTSRRDCQSCVSEHRCPLKRYIPVRST